MAQNPARLSSFYSRGQLFDFTDSMFLI